MGDAYFTKKLTLQTGSIELGTAPVVIAELPLTGGSYVVMARFDLNRLDPSETLPGMASFELSFGGAFDKRNCTPMFTLDQHNNQWSSPVVEAVALTVAGTAPPREVFHGQVTPPPKATLVCTLRNVRLTVENVTLTAIGVDAVHTV